MLVPFQIIRFVDSVDICDYKLRISSVILHMHFVCFGSIRVINANSVVIRLINSHVTLL